MTQIPLPFDPPLRVRDAERISKTLYDSETLVVKYANGKYSLNIRRHDLGGVDWDYLYKITLEEAREIVRLGYAIWWMTVAEGAR